MNPAEIISSVISGLAVLLLAGIARGLIGVRRDFRRFMTEHLWLLATTMWTRDKVLQIVHKLDLDPSPPPPGDLPPR